MTTSKHDREILDVAQARREAKSPDAFLRWLRTFDSVERRGDAKPLGRDARQELAGMRDAAREELKS